MIDYTLARDKGQHRAPSEIPKLVLRDVTKTFESTTRGAVTIALENVSFAVGDCEFLVIVGPSGCGKSTVLNILAGLTDATSGEILLDRAAKADRQSHIAYMFQKDLLFPWRTVRDNVALGVEVQGLGRAQARARAQDILKRFGMDAFAAKYPSQLSGGMRQRVALMRTLLCDREILLLDEPFAALDAMTRSVMQEWLLGIWENDRRTVIFITHDIEEAVFLGDRILVMSNRPGRIKAEFPIGLRRPRTHKIVTSSEFVDAKRLVLDEIHEENLSAAINSAGP